MSDIPPQPGYPPSRSEPVSVASRMTPPGHIPPNRAADIIPFGSDLAVGFGTDALLRYREHRRDDDECVIRNIPDNPIAGGFPTDRDIIRRCSECGVPIIERGYRTAIVPDPGP